MKILNQHELFFVNGQGSADKCMNETIETNSDLADAICVIFVAPIRGFVGLIDLLKEDLRAVVEKS